MVISNKSPIAQARKDINRFNRAVKKCQRELAAMKTSLRVLEGEDQVETDLRKFEEDLEAMLDFVEETSRLMRARWLSASMIARNGKSRREIP